MGKLFCVMGKSASGKDTVFRRLTEDSTLLLRKVVPYTTRPIRNGEKNGQDYYFVTDDVYKQMSAENKIIESRTYQTVSGPWHYFTADDGQIDLSKGNFILIGTLDVYTEICKFFGNENVSPVYLEVEDGLRLERALLREKQQSVPNYQEMCRRFLADCSDFSEENLTKAGIRQRYDNSDGEICYQKIRKVIMSCC
jgi:guanylate kinase